MKKIYMALIAMVMASGTESVIAQGVTGNQEVKTVVSANDDITTARVDSERLQKQVEAAQAKLVQLTTEVQGLIATFKAVTTIETRNDTLDKINELVGQINQQTQLIEGYSKALVANAVRIEGLEKKVE